MIVISIAVFLLSIPVVGSVICNVLLESRVSRLEEQIERLKVKFFKIWLLDSEARIKEFNFTEELENDGR